MKQAKCYTCDRITSNLLTANCSHKICFNCVKNNKNTHKCSFCTTTKSRGYMAFSPVRKNLLDKQRERSTRTKSIQQSSRYADHSPYGMKSSRRNLGVLQQSASSNNYQEISVNEQERCNQVGLLCKEHHQPLTMFSKSAKEAICSICLCSKTKYKDQIMPIKGAEQFLRRENHNQREQSRVVLSEVQNAYKTIKINHQQFEKYYSHNLRVLGEIFANLHAELQQKQDHLRKQMDQYFTKKLTQCNQISQDLQFLGNTLRDYRQENKENNTLTESLYVYSSFKVIRKTLKSLNLDYISYANKNVNLLEFNKTNFDSLLKDLVRFKEDLPLKQEERKKKRSHSSRVTFYGNNRSRNDSVSQTMADNILKTPPKPNGSKPKHQMSLCSNSSGLQMTEEERSLYKRLLKSRFKC